MSLLTLDKLLVLLVEPSSTQQRIISQHLQELGVQEIDCCHSAQEAFERIKISKPDLLISSMYLPDMTGTHFLEKIRNTEDALDIPFVLISSETSVRYLGPMRQAGVTAILPKPYKLQQLKKALCTTVDFIDPDTEKLDEYAIAELKILVVDDSLTSRRQIARLLNGFGVQHITEAENGRDATALIEQEYFDLIVTDYNMPEMDGQELTAYIREKSPQRGVPIVMITSESDSSRLAAVEQFGLSAICDKPFDPSVIKRILETSASYC